MHGASASARGDGGGALPPPKLLPFSKDIPSQSSINGTIKDKPIPLSIPARQFEHFEHTIQESCDLVTAMTTPFPDNCVIRGSSPSGGHL